jgi:hypothetical protein
LYLYLPKSKSHYEPSESRPVRLGVLPLLEQVTRCYFYLSDNYFHYFSSRAPYLMRERVRNLQCNNATSISSYNATDGLSAISSWCRAPNGAHNQILISLFDSYFVFSVWGSLTGTGWLIYTPGNWVPFPSTLTTRRDYGGGILTRLHTGYTKYCTVARYLKKA